MSEFERIPIDKIERVTVENIWGPNGEPTLLTFKIVKMKNILTALGTRKALPYFAQLLEEKKVSHTKLATRIKIHVSSEVLKKAVEGTIIHLEWIEK